MPAIRSMRSEISHRAAVLVVLAAALVMPNLVWPGDSASSGIRALLVQGVALTLLVLALPWGGRRTGSERRSLLSGPALPIVLLVAWSGFAYLRAPQVIRSYALGQLLALAGGVVIYAVLARHVTQRRGIETLVTALGGAAIASVIIAAITRSRGSGPLSGAFGNPQLYASFLMLMLPLLVAGALGCERLWRRTFLLFAAVFAGTGLLLTQNRSAWLGAAVGLAVLAVIQLRRSAAAGRVPKLAPAIPFVILALGLAVLVPVLVGSTSALAERTGGIRRDAREGSLDWRVQSWAAAYRMFLDRPITGQGLGSYALRSANYGAPSFSRLVALGASPSMTEMPHNQYFLLLSETGFVGLALWLGVLAAFVMRCGSGLTGGGSSLRRAVRAGCLAAVAAQFVDAFLNPAYQFADVSVFVWLILGLGVAAATPRRHEETEVAASTARPAWPAQLALRGAQVAMLAVGLFGIGTAYANHDSVPPDCHYTVVRGCKITPVTQTLPLPPKGSTAVFCKSFIFHVSFDCDGGQRSFDLTDDPATTWSTTSNCIFKQGKGNFCWQRPVPGGNACINISVPVTAVWQVNQFQCTGNATLMLRPPAG